MPCLLRNCLTKVPCLKMPRNASLFVNRQPSICDRKTIHSTFLFLLISSQLCFPVARPQGTQETSRVNCAYDIKKASEKINSLYHEMVYDMFKMFYFRSVNAVVK